VSKQTLTIDGEIVTVTAKRALGVARYDGGGSVLPSQMGCGHEVTVQGDVYYEADDGRRWCIFCARTR
jgi:hypothetical protein